MSKWVVVLVRCFTGSVSMILLGTATSEGAIFLFAWDELGFPDPLFRFISEFIPAFLSEFTKIGLGLVSV